MGLLINRYTLTLLWCATPVMAIYSLGRGRMDDAAIWGSMFMIGLAYMTGAHFKHWWPFRSGKEVTYVVAKEVQPEKYGQQPQYYRQDPYAKQGYQGYEQARYPDPNYQEPGQR